jgi:transposase
MSEQESRRAGVLQRVKAGELKQVEAAAMLGLSYRQTKRLYGRYRRQGVGGLVHGNAGKRSNRAKPEELRKRALKIIAEQYQGPGERFGPTLAAEHLEQDHRLSIDGETLRRWMLGAGLWKRERKRKAYRQRRQRRAHFGELVQMDGSFEDWFEKRGPRGCLINLVDDATSTVLARMEDEETTWAAGDALRAWVELYGIPRALYVDWKNVYHHVRSQKAEREGAVVSQFQGMCRKLGIELIGANSPQAKGRVERSHGTHQDRLIKKMRLKRIASYEQANAYLMETYLPDHNARYAVAPPDAVDFHEPVPPHVDLRDVFCLEQERTVSQDWVVQYGSRWLQIEREPYVAAGSKVTLREQRDGSLQLVWRQQPLRWHDIDPAPAKTPAPPKLKQPQRLNHPAADHPWKKRLLAARA